MRWQDQIKGEQTGFFKQIEMENKTTKVKDYITAQGLDGSSRRRELVDKRTYLVKYLRDQGETLKSIGELFNRNHATVIHALKKYEDVSTLKCFVNTCVELIDDFPIIGEREKLSKVLDNNNSFLVKLTLEEFNLLQTYRVENMIYTKENTIKHLINNYLK